MIRSRPLIALLACVASGAGAVRAEAAARLEAELVADAPGGRTVAVKAWRVDDGGRAPATEVQAAPSAGHLVRDADGTLRVALPESRAPLTLAVALVDGPRAGAAFLAVPGHTTLPVATDRPASVSVEVAGRTFGPVWSEGRVAVPIDVPPGVRRARVRAVDGLGNVRTLDVDLDVPATGRIALAGPEAAVAPGSFHRLVLAAADAAGAPAQVRETPRLTARRGTVGPLRSAGAGFWTADYRAPTRPGRDTLVAALPSAPDAPPARLRVEVAGAGGWAPRVAVSAGVLDGAPGALGRFGISAGGVQAGAAGPGAGVTLGLEAALGDARPLVTVPLSARLEVPVRRGLSAFLEAGPLLAWAPGTAARAAAVGVGARAAVGAAARVGPGWLSFALRAGTARIGTGEDRREVEGPAAVLAYALVLQREGGP